MSSLTGQQRNETYRALLTADVAPPVTGMSAVTRYSLTWGDGSSTGVSIGNGEVACQKIILGAATLQASGTGTITFPEVTGTVIVRTGLGAFYLGQASFSVGSTSTNAHTFTSAATAARAINIEDVAGTLMIRPASGNIFLGTTFSSGPSSTNAHTHSSSATAPRTITWPDASGTPVLQAPGQVFLSSFTTTLASDVTNSTTSDVAIPFPTLTLDAGVYLVTALLKLKSAATGTGVRYALLFPGGLFPDTFDGSYVDYLTGSATGNSPVANTTFVTQRQFMLVLTSTTTFAPTCKSENGGTTITVLAGSVVSALKIG